MGVVEQIADADPRRETLTVSPTETGKKQRMAAVTEPTGVIDPRATRDPSGLEGAVKAARPFVGELGRANMGRGPGDPIRAVDRIMVEAEPPEGRGGAE